MATHEYQDISGDELGDDEKEEGQGEEGDVRSPALSLPDPSSGVLSPGRDGAAPNTGAQLVFNYDDEDTLCDADADADDVGNGGRAAGTNPADAIIEGQKPAQSSPPGPPSVRQSAELNPATHRPPPPVPTGDDDAAHTSDVSNAASPPRSAGMPALDPATHRPPPPVPTSPDHDDHRSHESDGADNRDPSAGQKSENRRHRQTHRRSKRQPPKHSAWMVAPFDVQSFMEIGTPDPKIDSLPHTVCTSQFNRYPDILPNTETRVNLRVVDNNPIGTFYNANYIRGSDGKRFDYIAAMSPMASTVHAFWRMVWDARVASVVMATDLYLGDDVHCVRYWPTPGSALMFDSITVHCLSEQEVERHNYVISRLQIHRTQSDGSVERRDIRHYRLYGLPHDDVPRNNGRPNPSSLIAAWHRLYASQNHRNARTSTMTTKMPAAGGRGGRGGAGGGIDAQQLRERLSRDFDVKEPGSAGGDGGSRVESQVVSGVTSAHASDAESSRNTTPRRLSISRFDPNSTLTSTSSNNSSGGQAASTAASAGDAATNATAFPVPELKDVPVYSVVSKAPPPPLAPKQTRRLALAAGKEEAEVMVVDENMYELPVRAETEQEVQQQMDAFALPPSSVRRKHVTRTPVLVHCDSGCHRTSAVIAVDICLRQLAAYGKTDPCAVIRQMREDRMSMAPRTDFYELTHHACMLYAKHCNIPLSFTDLDTAAGTDTSHPDEAEPDSEREVEHEGRAWYHGALGKIEAQNLIHAHVYRMADEQIEDGLFLVRKSPHTEDAFVVSFWANGGVHHRPIMLRSACFWCEDKPFSSIVDVVEQHTKKRLGWPALLTRVIPSATHRVRRSLADVTVSSSDIDMLAQPAPSAVDAAEFVLDGYQLRQSGWVLKYNAKQGTSFFGRPWQKRWLVLQDTMLKYFKKQAYYNDPALGYINICAQTQVVKHGPSTFVVDTPKRQSTFQCDNQQEADRWRALLKQAVSSARALAIGQTGAAPARSKSISRSNTARKQRYKSLRSNPLGAQAAPLSAGPLSTGNKSSTLTAKQRLYASAPTSLTNMFDDEAGHSDVPQAGPMAAAPDNLAQQASQSQAARAGIVLPPSSTRSESLATQQQQQQQQQQMQRQLQPQSQPRQGTLVLNVLDPSEVGAESSADATLKPKATATGKSKRVTKTNGDDADDDDDDGGGGGGGGGGDDDDGDGDDDDGWEDEDDALGALGGLTTSTRAPKSDKGVQRITSKRSYNHISFVRKKEVVETVPPAHSFSTQKHQASE